MTATEKVYTDLTTFAGLQALVNNGDSPQTYRIHHEVAPQDTDRPFITYTLVAGTPINSMAKDTGTGTENNIYQVTVWADTPKEANTVLAQVRLAMAASSINYIPTSKRDSFDFDTRLYSAEYDFSQWYR